LLLLATAQGAYAQGGLAPTRADSCAGVVATVAGGVDWTPGFCDEFNGAEGTPDAAVWAYDVGDGGFGNGEIQTYCGPPGYAQNSSVCPSTFSPITNTAYVDGHGRLVVQAHRDGAGHWLSARMKTEGHANFHYGRIEVSIRLPNTRVPGLWPAFSMLGSNKKSVGWPDCGEADVVEVWSPIVRGGPGPFGNEAPIHTRATRQAGVQPNGAFRFPLGTRNDGGFHAYGVIWSANMMQFYVDRPEKPFYIVTASDLSRTDLWPFDAPFFLLLNVAVGGTLGGTPSDLAGNPDQMVVDYVRQYTAALLPAPDLRNPPPITVTAGAVAGNTSTFRLSGTGYVYFTCSTNAPEGSCAVRASDALNRQVANAGAKEAVTVTASTATNRLQPRASASRIGNRLGRIAVPALALCALIPLLIRRIGSRILVYALLATVLPSLALAGAWLANRGRISAANAVPDGTRPGHYAIRVNAFTESNTSGRPDASVEVPLTVK